MMYQVWMAPDDEFGVWCEKLTDEEAEALKEEGFHLAHEFEAVCKANAEAYFIAWCDEQSGMPNKVERIDFHKAGLK